MTHVICDAEDLDGMTAKKAECKKNIEDCQSALKAAREKFQEAKDASRPPPVISVLQKEAVQKADLVKKAKDKYKKCLGTPLSVACFLSDKCGPFLSKE